MAGGSGSFFKNCKSEKVGEYVRGRQEGSRRREGEKNRQMDWKRWWSWRCAGFKASDFNIQELRTAIRQVIMLWFIPEEIQISLSQWNVNYESYEWIWNSISRQGPMFCRLPWPTLSQLHANENRFCGDFWSFTFMLQRRHHHFLLSGGISNTRNSSTILQH